MLSQETETFIMEQLLNWPSWFKFIAGAEPRCPRPRLRYCIVSTSKAELRHFRLSKFVAAFSVHAFPCATQNIPQRLL